MPSGLGGRLSTTAETSRTRWRSVQAHVAVAIPRRGLRSGHCDVGQADCAAEVLSPA